MILSSVIFAAKRLAIARTKGYREQLLLGEIAREQDVLDRRHEEILLHGIPNPLPRHVAVAEASRLANTTEADTRLLTNENEQQAESRSTSRGLAMLLVRDARIRAPASFCGLRHAKKTDYADGHGEGIPVGESACLDPDVR